MKRTTLGTILIVCALFFVVTPAFSQKKLKVNGCGYIIPPKQKKLVTNFQSVYEAGNIVKQMLDAVNWNENFRLQERNGIQNAYATIINNIRWIVYDNNFLEDIDAYTKTKWSSISVMAHEVGHHYYDHVVSQSGSTIPKELEADAFSGYVMALLGASKEQSVAAISAIASEKASRTHPGKADRVAAISQGWNKGAESVAKNNPQNTPAPQPQPQPKPQQPVPPPPPPTTPIPPRPQTPAPAPQQTNPANDPSWIALYVNSIQDETVMLSDDGRNFEQAVVKAGQPFVFKFEIFDYGWLRLRYYNGYRIYRLNHGADYIIVWNRRTGNWVVSQITD